MGIERYIVYGAGGIGASLGAQLARAQKDVLFIARGAHRDALLARGLDYWTSESRERIRIPVAAGPEEIAFRDGDAVLLAMKTQDTLPALESLARVAGSGVPILCAQNGVENERLALRRFRRVLGLAVWIPASFLEPGVVHNFGPRAPIEIGGAAHADGIDRLAEEVARDLRAAGFAAEVRADVMAWKHAKLLTNAVATLEAICGSRQGLEDLVERVRSEGRACHRAAGIEVVPSVDYEARVAFAIERMGEIEGVPRAGGSSAQSLARGAGSIETDYINGEIVLLGRAQGVPTPVNEAIQRSANAMAAARCAEPLEAAELRRRIAAIEQGRA